ncbi:MAG: Ig-like domain-containing protein [Gammaproteobacteria bacterium]|nr:Ig-like domain-containing protein [Gammaproteobacteria bacterium]
MRSSKLITSGSLVTFTLRLRRLLMDLVSFPSCLQHQVLVREAKILLSVFKWRLRTVVPVFVAVLSFMSPPVAAQSDLGTLFGPETFVRSKGQPVTVAREFSTVGFRGPFVLHLRNGDEGGKNRVSTAEVWLNGQQLFGPSDFSQNVSGYDLEVGLTESSHLQVWMASAPGSELTMWIEGEPTVVLDEASRVTATLTPVGGTITTTGTDGAFFTLEVPAGALSGPVDVSLTPVFSIPGMPLNEGVLAAAQFSPDGLQLAIPATLTIALPGLEVPPKAVGFLFQEGAAALELLPAQISDTAASFQLTHFSEGGLMNLLDEDLEAAAIITQGIIIYTRVLAALRNASSCSQSAGLANEVGNFLFTTGDILADNPRFTFGPINCTGPDPTQPEQCSNFFELSEALRFDLEDAIERLFSVADTACAGDPSQERIAFRCIKTAQDAGSGAFVPNPFLDRALAAAKSCGIHSLDIFPTQMALKLDETGEFEAIAKDIAGTVLPDRQFVFGASPSNIATLEPGGLTAEGSTLELATCVETGVTDLVVGDALAAEEGVFQPRGAFRNDAELSCIDAEVSIDPPRVFLFEGESADLEATATDTNGDPIRIEPDLFFAWEASDETIAAVERTDAQNSSKASVAALQEGTTSVTATLIGNNDPFPTVAEGSAEINVMNLTGTWNLVYTSTDNDCVPPGPIPPPEDVQVNHQLADNIITVQQADFGASLAGFISFRPSPAELPRISLEPATSTESANCSRFFADVCGFLDFGAGCEERVMPISCQESQRAEVSLTGAGRSASGRLGWLVGWTYEFTDNFGVRTSFSDSCEGIDVFEATKQ